MINVRELKVVLKENNIQFYAYWSKKRLIALANEHDLLPKKAPKKALKKASEKERSKDPKYDGLKTIMKNPRKVSLEDIETGEIKTFPSLYKVGRFIDQAPQTIIYWDGRVWKNKYKIEIQ